MEIKQLSPGDRMAPEGIEVSHELAKAFTLLVKDTNTSHYDDAAAQRLGFPAAIQHSAIATSLLMRLLAVSRGQVLADGDELEFTFIAPVFLGDVTHAHGTVTQVEDGVMTSEIWCENQRGDKVIVGRARLGNAGK